MAGVTGIRSGLVGGLAAGVVVVAAMVGAPPAAGPGLVDTSPPLVTSVTPATQAAVVVPMARKKKPTLVFSNAAKLVVDVNPDLSGSKNWKVKLQRQSAGKWRTVGVYRTRGSAEMRAFAVQAGTYRVKVYARPGYKSRTTQAHTYVVTPLPPGFATVRVSVRSDGRQARGWSQGPAISADGRWITYWSSAANLVEGDTNQEDDVFLYDRDTGTTRRVSVRSDGGQGSGVSEVPAISADGRWITYWSFAPNLVSGDTNEVADVFLYDRDTGATRRVSVRSDGGQTSGGSSDPAISADGRWITYLSDAPNLVDGDTNDVDDVFLYDRDSGTTRRVSLSIDGSQTPSWSRDPEISPDGRWITYLSAGSRFLYDRDTGATKLATTEYFGRDQSADGRWFSHWSGAPNLVDGDTNDVIDVFLNDRSAGTTLRVSVRSDGAQANGGNSADPAVSADGRWITYTSFAPNLVNGDTNGGWDVFLTRMW